MEGTKGEFFWVNLYRIIGVIIGVSPFVPNLLYYYGFNDVKIPLGLSDGWFIIIGFLFVWGSNNFGKWSNSLGSAIVNGVKRK